MKYKYLKIERCKKCNKLSLVVPSNNPLVEGLCTTCIGEQVDPNRLEQGNFFCRTYNYPWKPQRWMELVEQNTTEDNSIFAIYVEERLEESEDKNLLFFKGKTSDLWKLADEEWEDARTLQDLLQRLEPIKNSFMLRNRIKWGGDYSFEELMLLENLYRSTVEASDSAAPMQLDAIKKACKISCEIDKAIEARDAKSIKELTGAYKEFIKSAQIEDVMQTSDDNVISTVAQLADFIESKGGVYTYYDDVDRDIVDKTIRDMKEYLTTLVKESTNLDSMLELIAQNYKVEKEQELFDSAAEKDKDRVKSLENLDELFHDLKPGENKILDKELEAEEVDLDDLDD